MQTLQHIEPTIFYAIIFALILVGIYGLYKCICLHNEDDEWPPKQTRFSIPPPAPKPKTKKKYRGLMDEVLEGRIEATKKDLQIITRQAPFHLMYLIETNTQIRLMLDQRMREYWKDKRTTQEVYPEFINFLFYLCCYSRSCQDWNREFNWEKLYETQSKLAFQRNASITDHLNHNKEEWEKTQKRIIEKFNKNLDQLPEYMQPIWRINPDDNSQQEEGRSIDNQDY